MMIANTLMLFALLALGTGCLPSDLINDQSAEEAHGQLIFNIESINSSDSRLISLLDVNFNYNLSLAYDCLQKVTFHLIQKGDRRAEFAITYLAVTQETLNYLQPYTAGDAKYKFSNSTWVGQYMAVFADLYRKALLNWEIGQHHLVPLPWQSHFKVFNYPETLIAQNLYWGVNAHVNHDLAYAVRDAVQIPVDDASTQLSDNKIINQIIADVSSHLMPVIVTIYKSQLDVSKFQNILNFLNDGLVSGWRNLAWRHGVALASPSCGEACRKAHELAVETLSNSVSWTVSNALPSQLRKRLKLAEGEDPLRLLCSLEPWGYCSR
ncbi:hypothetical protein MP228_009384 [Amoeboaphelidium protococcarum]|nr:hypothetical protein MP228_009384 [Amoeboaphelidium protococcarum]